jgi:hypothetical protein
MPDYEKLVEQVEALADLQPSAAQSETALEAAEAISTLLKEREWQDISTFPRDGEGYLACHANYAGGIQEVVYWDGDKPDYPFGGESVNFAPSRFTHWRPLPEPPSPKVSTTAAPAHG